MRRARRRARRRATWRARLDGAAARGDRVRRRVRGGGRGGRAAGRARAAGRCWPTRPRACAAAPHDRSHVVAHYDVLLRAGAFAARAPPRPGAARGRHADVAAAARLARRRRAGRGRPPRGLARPHARGGADGRRAAAARCSTRWPPEPARPRPGLARRPGASADALVPAALAAMPEPFEGRVARGPRAGAARRRPRVAQLLDADPRRGGVLPRVAQAAPLPRRPRRQRHRRRGVLGGRRRARVRAGPTFVLTGDVALVHDVGGLLAARARRSRPHRGLREQRRRRDLRLPAGGRSRRPRAYERHIATPHGVDLAALAAARRARAPPGRRRRPSSRPRWRTPGLVEVRTDRAANVELHAELVRRRGRFALGPGRRVPGATLRGMHERAPARGAGCG